ncbi:hypothetical protein Btru_015197 [Bulinus truncatus]|nr:hypothetical protein Btru_015197 [Bulinus truncatus]
MSDEFIVSSDPDDTETYFPRPSLSISKWIDPALGVAGVGLFIAVVVMSVKSYNQDTNTITSQVCLTKECMLASASILSKMDQDIDPCVDMYSYACGGWLKNAEVPNYLKGWNIEKELELDVHKTLKKILKTDGHSLQGKNSTAIEKLKKLYQQCMDDERLEYYFRDTFRVLQVMSELGSWTLTNSHITPWNNDTWSLQTSIEQLHMFTINGLFTMSVTEETDDNDKINYILQFQNSGLTLNVKDYTDKAMMEAFKHMMFSFCLKLLSSPPYAKKDWNKVQSFEKQLAQIVLDSETEGGQEFIQLDDLQELFSPWLNISHYLTARFNGAELPSGINVSIITPGYFHKLKDLIKETDKKVLANYMMWNFVNSITDALPIDFNKIKKTQLHKDILPRFEMCMRKTTDVLDLAITALYMDSNYQLNFQSKPKVNETVHEIKNEIVANLKSLTWLDYRTRKHLQNKSELLKYNIGYPDWIMYVDKLDEHYEKVNVDSDYYLDNYLNTSRYTISKNLELLWKSPDEKQWIESPIAGAPFYFNRTVYITTGYLQSPLYDPTFPV